MRKLKKYLFTVVAVVGFLVLCVFTRFPIEAVKVVSSVGKTFKQVILKEKPSYSEGFDVITSASIRVDDSNSSRKS